MSGSYGICRLGLSCGKSLCPNLVFGRQEIAKRVVMMTPRLFRHVRRGPTWDHGAFNSVKMEHETEHQRLNVCQQMPHVANDGLCIEELYKTCEATGPGSNYYPTCS
jgi:hypothetical protein